MAFKARRKVSSSVLISGLFAGLCIAQPLAAEFGSQYGSGDANSAMGMQQQQMRSVQGQGQGFGQGDAAADGFVRQNAAGDGEVNFSLRFKGKGRAEGQNEQKQSRKFAGQMFQSRALQQQMRGNGQSSTYGSTQGMQMMPMAYAPYGSYRPYYGNPYYANGFNPFTAFNPMAYTAYPATAPYYAAPVQAMPNNAYGVVPQ